MIIILFETNFGKITKMFSNQILAETFIIENSDYIRNIKVFEDLGLRSESKNTVEKWSGIIGKENADKVAQALFGRLYNPKIDEFSAEQVNKYIPGLLKGIAGSKQPLQKQPITAGFGKKGIPNETNKPTFGKKI